MKNQKNPHSFVHSLLGLVRRELELTLAVLVLLAFVVGFSFAQTPTPEAPASDTQVAQTQSANLIIGGQSYSGISFGAAKAGMYRVNSLTGGSQYFTAKDGLTLVDSGSMYTLNLALDTPLDGSKWYFDGADLKITINGQAVTSPTQGFSLAGATNISIKTAGATALRSLSRTPGSSAPANPTTSVETLYLAPATTFLTEGTSRSFVVVALDSAGSSIDTKGYATWTVNNTSVATINSTTGLLQAIKAGTVQVTVTVGKASATATVTVQAKTEEPQPIVNEPTRDADRQIVAPPITDTTPREATDTSSETPEPAASTNETSTTDTTEATATAAPTTVAAAVRTLFSEEAIATRIITAGSANLPQAQINAVAASLPTATAKLAFRVNVAVREIGLTLKTIVVGNVVTDTTTGDKIVTPSAPRVIANFVLRLLGADTGASAGTMKIGGDGDLGN